MADPTIKSLRAVAAVAQTRHFGHASALLGLAPSSLSEQITMLERQLGEKIFERSARQVLLTSFGGQFLPYVESVVMQHDRMQNWMDSHRKSACEVLRMGYAGGLGYELATRWIRATSAQLDCTAATCDNPDPHRVAVVNVGPRDSEQALLRDEVDVALALDPIDVDCNKLRGLEILEEPRVVVVRPTHHLAGRDHVGLGDLRDERIITPTQGRHRADRWWAVDPRPDGHQVRYGPRAHDIEGALHLVCTGSGVLITGTSVKQILPQRGSFEAIPLTGVSRASTWVLSRASDRRPATRIAEATAHAVGTAVQGEVDLVARHSSRLID